MLLSLANRQFKTIFTNTFIINNFEIYNPSSMSRKNGIFKFSSHHCLEMGYLSNAWKLSVNKLIAKKNEPIQIWDPYAL